MPPLLGEYIPTRVEAVRLRIERVLLGGVSSFDLRLRCDGSDVSRTGGGGDEDSVEAGVRSNFRRGMGRRMVVSSLMVKAVLAQDLKRMAKYWIPKATSLGLLCTDS